SVVSGSKSRLRRAEATTQPPSPGAGASSSGTTSWSFSCPDWAVARAGAPRFSVTLTSAGTPGSTGVLDQRGYSGRAPQITSRPSAWVRPFGNGTVPCPTGTAPSAIVVVTRFIGEEPMNEATNV